MESYLKIELHYSMYYLTLLLLLCQELILEVNELRYRLQEMESDRIQYEKKLKSTKVSLPCAGLLGQL